VAVCSWLILLVGDGELHGFCSLASRAVIGGSDPCVLPARPRAVALVWSRSDARACRRTGGLDACSGRLEAHGESRAGEGAGVGARGGLGGRSAP